MDRFLGGERMRRWCPPNSRPSSTPWASAQKMWASFSSDLAKWVHQDSFFGWGKWIMGQWNSKNMRQWFFNNDSFCLIQKRKLEYGYRVISMLRICLHNRLGFMGILEWLMDASANVPMTQDTVIYHRTDFLFCKWEDKHILDSPCNRGTKILKMITPKPFLFAT